MEDTKFESQYPSGGEETILPVPPVSSKKPFGNAIKIVVGIVILAILAAGVSLATRIWDPLWNPFRPEPEEVISEMSKKMEEVKTLRSETKINFIVKEEAEEKFKMAMNFVNDADTTEEENSKSAGNFYISFGIEGMEFSLAGENKIIGKDSYLKLTTIPALPFIEPFLSQIGINLSQLKNQWIKFDEESTKSLLESLGISPTPEMEEEMRKSEERQKEMIEKFQAILKDKKLYIVKRELPDIKIKNQKVYHYLVALNKEEVKKLIPELLKTLIEMQVFPQLPTETEWQEFEKEFPQEFDEFFEKIGDIEGEIFIGKKDLYLYKIQGEKEIDFAKIDPAAKGKISIKLDMDFSNFNKPVKIEVPEEYKTLEEIFRFPKIPFLPSLLEEEQLPFVSPKGFRTYENIEYGYSIAYPENWKIIPDILPDPKIIHAIGLSEDPNDPNKPILTVVIHKETFPDLESAKKRILEESEIPIELLKKAREIIINQRKGLEFIFSYAGMEARYVIFSLKNKSYRLLMFSPSEYSEIFDKIINSFVIK